MNHIFEDGTVEVLVDGKPKRRNYVVEVGRGMRAITPETRENEELIRFVDGTFQIVTLYGDPA